MNDDTNEKIYYLIKTDDPEEVRSLLNEKSHEEVKAICETTVNTFVWTKEQNLRDGINCLHYAAKRGTLGVFREMLKQEGIGKLRLDIDIPSTILGWSPLHYASYSGYVGVQKLILQRLATVDAVAIDNKTPLHLAVQQGMRYAVATLVAKGANVNVQDNLGNTPLHYATDAKSLRICNISPKHSREIIDFLIKKGADVSISNHQGDMPIHCALQAKMNNRIIKTIALQNKSTNTLLKENRSGLSAMHLCKDKESLQVLLLCGADVNKKSPDGQTPLHIYSYDFELTSFLLSQKADKTIRDKQNRVPLHSAMTQSSPCLETVKLLAGEYKLITADDNQGMTPLHLICKNQYKTIKVKNEKGVIEEQEVTQLTTDPILELLIENGADIDAQNKNGQTPLHILIKAKSYARATYLISKGASLDITDDRNLTPRKLNPTWARNSLSNLHTTRNNNMPVFYSSRSNPNAIKKVERKSPLPKWVTAPNLQTLVTDNKGTPELLSRELTSLQDDVKDVKTFLEVFSNEGSSDKGTLEREVTQLQDDVKTMKNELKRASKDCIM